MYVHLARISRGIMNDVRLMERKNNANSFDFHWTSHRHRAFEFYPFFYHETNNFQGIGHPTRFKE